MPFTCPTLESAVEVGVWFAKVLAWVYPAEEQVPVGIVVASLHHLPSALSVLAGHHCSVHASLVAG